MSTTSKARAITRWFAVGIMGAAVVTATADGFAQSYAGLYAWALEHGLHGWKAASFPLMVDLLIVVGELGLFLLAIDAYSLQRKHFLTWFDFLLPLMIAVAGWTASLIFNVGRVQERDFSYQATAAVPPIVSMLGLLVLLRTLHRYVSDRPSGDRRDGGAPESQLAPAGPEGATADPALASDARPFRFISIRDGLGHDGSPADDPARNGGGVRLVRLAGWPSRNGSQDGQNGDQIAGQDAGQDGGQNGGQNADKTAEPEVAAEVVPGVHDSTYAGNGQSNAATLTLRHATKDRLLEELHEQHGNLQAALEAMEAEGLTYDGEEARRIRRNNWLPYVVFRLLAQHGGEVNQVSQALVERRIDCEPAVLEELARSWQ